MVRSRDGGKTWATGSDIAALVGGALDNFVIDPGRPTTVYGNCADHTCVIRSLDGGKHWADVLLPAGRSSFMVTFDPHEPGRLVGRSSDAGVPADRVYLFANHGATWRPARCPGDLHGACPAFTLDNVFGRGRAYGFYKDGIHAFSGTGAAGPRLAISAHLPASPSHILAADAGTMPGTPVYLLASGRHGPFAGLLYRSLDAGLSWHLVNPRA